MEDRTADMAAVLESEICARERLQRLMQDAGIASAGFETPAELGGELARGRRFTMLLLSLDNSVAHAKAQLMCLQALAGPTTPILLLTTREQVDLAAYVMRRWCNDFLLAPYSQDELGLRLAMMHRTSAGVKGWSGGDTRIAPGPQRVVVPLDLFASGAQGESGES